MCEHVSACDRARFMLSLYTRPHVWTCTHVCVCTWVGVIRSHVEGMGLARGSQTGNIQSGSNPAPRQREGRSLGAASGAGFGLTRASKTRVPRSVPSAPASRPLGFALG